MSGHAIIRTSYHFLGSHPSLSLSTSLPLPQSIVSLSPHQSSPFSPCSGCTCVCLCVCGVSTDGHLAWTLWLGYGPALSLLCCLWTFLTEELANETKALEDVLREKEGNNSVYSAHGLIVCVCNAVDTCEPAISFIYFWHTHVQYSSGDKSRILLFMNDWYYLCFYITMLIFMVGLSC